MYGDDEIKKIEDSPSYNDFLKSSDERVKAAVKEYKEKRDELQTYYDRSVNRPLSRGTAFSLSKNFRENIAALMAALIQKVRSMPLNKNTTNVRSFPPLPNTRRAKDMRSQKNKDEFNALLGENLPQPIVLNRTNTSTLQPIRTKPERNTVISPIQITEIPTMAPEEVKSFLSKTSLGAPGFFKEGEYDDILNKLRQLIETNKRSLQNVVIEPRDIEVIVQNIQGNKDNRDILNKIKLLSNVKISPGSTFITELPNSGSNSNSSSSNSNSSNSGSNSSSSNSNSGSSSNSSNSGSSSSSSNSGSNSSSSSSNSNSGSSSSNSNSNSDSNIEMASKPIVGKRYSAPPPLPPKLPAAKESKNVPVVNAPKNVPVVNAPKNVPVANAPKNVPVANAPKNVPVVNTPKNVPVVNTPKNVPVANAPKNVPTVNAPKNVPVVNAPKNIPAPAMNFVKSASSLAVNAPTTVSAPVVNAPATESATPSSGCGVSPIVVSGQSGIKYNVYVVQQPAEQKGGKRNTKTRKNKNSKAQK